MKKRLIAWLLSLTMAVSMSAVPVAAEETQIPETAVMEELTEDVTPTIEENASPELTETQPELQKPLEAVEDAATDAEKNRTTEELQLPEEITESAALSETDSANNGISLLAKDEVPTPAEAYQRMIALKDKYPQGMSWTNANSYNWNGGIFSGGSGCAGFAFLLSDAAFGSLPARMMSGITIADVHSGDILRINDDRNSVIVLEVYSDYVVTADGMGAVDWRGTMSAAAVAASDYMLTRYPLGYFGEVVTVSFDPNGGIDGPDYLMMDTALGGRLIPNEIPKRAGYSFAGWSQNADSATAEYQPGDRIRFKSDVRLYAVWEKADYVTVTTFPAGKNVTVKNADQEVIFKIIPDQSAIYSFESVSSSGDPYVNLYDENLNFVDYNDDSGDGYNFLLNHPLEKGKVYYLGMSCYGSRSGAFDLLINRSRAENWIEGPFPEIVSVSLEAGKNLSYYFAPDQTGNYTFESKGSHDSLLRVYDADSQKLAADDDSGEGRNFKLTMELKKDKIYLLAFMAYNDTAANYEVWINTDADQSAASILEQPQNVRAVVGQSVTFHVSAENAASYQWQYSKDGINWTNSGLTGNKTSTLKMTVSATNAKNVYRCLITGKNGDRLASESVKAELIPGAEISSQPKSVAATVGTTVKFTVAAANVAKGGYQWYYSKDGVKWTKSTVTSATTGTLSLKVSDTNKGNLYRCTLTGLDGNTVNSQTAGIVVINSQPENVTGTDGKNVSFSVSADNISAYQWQYTKDGVKWSNSTVTSATTRKLSLKVTDATKANTYRCKLTTTNGIIFYTDSVRIIDNSLKILLQPMNMTCRLGENARFSVHAENAASYQWQYSKDGVKWSNSTLSSAKTDTITFKVSDSNKSNRYRCKLVGEDGSTLYTKTVSILLMP